MSKVIHVCTCTIYDIYYVLTIMLQYYMYAGMCDVCYAYIT